MTVCWWAGLYFPHMHWSQNRRWGNRPFLSHNPFLYEDPPCESMGGCGGIMATAALLHTRSRAYTHIHTHTHGTVPTCCGQGVLALSRFSSSIHRIIHSPTAPPPPELYPSLVPSISFCASSFTSSSFSLYPSIPATSHQSVSVQDPWQTVPITAATASSSFSSSSSTSSFSLLLFFSSSDAAAPADALTLPPWSRAAAAASPSRHRYWYWYWYRYSTQIPLPSLSLSLLVVRFHHAGAQAQTGCTEPGLQQLPPPLPHPVTIRSRYYNHVIIGGELPNLPEKSAY